MPRRVVTRWLVLAGLLVVAFTATVVALNLTLYSASGFVGSYLGALARQDVDGALGMPGVTLPEEGGRALVVPAALAGLTDIRQLSDTDEGSGRHTVVYRYRAGSMTGTSSFEVRHTGARFGLFSGWKFSTSPAAVLDVTPQNASAFDANSVPLASTAPDVATRLVVLAPAAVTLSHTSSYLEAPKRTVLVSAPGSTVDAAVDIRANSTFVREVQTQLDKFLASCVTQKVLLPTGCPMGKEIQDRVQDDPTWSMVTYPPVAITPGATAGTWTMRDTVGVAHLKVQVRSIFDGTVSTFDSDVDFTVGFTITFQADGTPVITANY